jgi:hypothetical protein
LIHKSRPSSGPNEDDTLACRFGNRSVNALNRAVNRIVTEIHTGLRHGHFEYTLTCEIISQGKRRLILRAGKHYQFLIGPEECETGAQASDPRDEGAEKSNV